MSLEFDSYEIRDICDINNSSYSPKESWSFFNYLDTKNITKGKIDEIKYLDPLEDIVPSRAKRKVNNKDIIYSTVRPNQEHYGLIENQPKNFLVSTGFTTLKVNTEKAIPEYVYYFITQNHITESLQTIAEQSTTSYPSIRPSDIGDLIIPLPPLHIQYKISSILRNIDIKIKLNEQINHNLDTILNSIFKEQFIKNFSPEKEKLIFKKIGDLPLIITDYVANGSFASLKENVSILDEEDYAYFIRNTDLKSQNFEKYVNKHSYDFLKKSSLFGNEVIISNVGDVGSVFLCPFLDNPMTLGNNMILVKTKENSTNLNFYLFLLFNSEFGQYLLSTVTSGSVQLKFNKTEFKSLELFIPKDKYLKEFNNTISPIFEYKTKISDEIKNLNNLRDSLLPKLMSGEIDVSQINCDLD